MSNYPKYEINPEAEIQGVALLTLAQSQNLYNFTDLVEKYGYDQINPDEWYSLQSALMFLQDLTERHSSTENMVSIGMKLFDVMPLPPEVTTIADGLGMFNLMNQTVQRNVEPSRDWYEVEQIDDEHIKFVDKGAYPHDLVYGEVYSVARRLRPDGLKPIVEREYINPDNPDSDGAVYHITLKQ